MVDAGRPDVPGGALFGGVDPRLNVFALANGMGLEKHDDRRRLEWFFDGLERCIAIGSDGDGTFHVRVESSKPGGEVRSRAAVGTGLSPDDLLRILPAAIERANGS